MPLCYLDDQLLPLDEATVPVSNRGFRYGDGVFETIRISQGQPYQWELHMKRLRQGVETLGIMVSLPPLYTQACTLIKENNQQEGVLRIAVSRKGESQGYLPLSDEACVLIETMPLPDGLPEKASLWLTHIIKPSPRMLPVHIKSMQGMNSMLARMDAKQHDCFEALLLNDQKQVCETSSGNIFWIKEGRLFTPSVETGILPGTIRDAVIRVAEMPVEEGCFSLDELLSADVAFITNVAWLVLPVSDIHPIGLHWECFPAIQMLQQQLYHDLSS